MNDDVPRKALGHCGAIAKLIREQMKIIDDQRKEINRLNNEIRRLSGLPLAEPKLPDRAITVLRKHLGVAPDDAFNPSERLDDIEQLNAAYILREPNFGLTSFRALEKWLAFHGRAFKGEFPSQPGDMASEENKNYPSMLERLALAQLPIQKR
jgi:hypothetical protein